MVGRRRFVGRMAGGVVAGLVGSVVGRRLAPRAALAFQVPGAPSVPTVQRLTDHVSLVTSGGTNVLALTTPEGVVLVDSGAPDRVDGVLASIGQVAGAAPIRMAFNTHFHPENTGANEALRGRGAAIVAHEQTRLWMSTPVWVPAEDRYRQPRPALARPTETFRVDGTKTVGGERIDYGYLIEAHTSGDIYVRFRGANVLAVGDVASPVRDPELDYFTGAWIGGRVDAMDRLLSLCDGRSRIVPGTGPVMTKAQLAAERDVMKAVYDRSVDRVREGDDANDMLEAGVLRGLARTWADPRRFLYDVQKGLWAHHNKLSPNVV